MKKLLPMLLLILFWSTNAAGLNVGDKVSDFSLSAVEGSLVSLSQFGDKVVVLEWFNSGCPFVMKHYRSQAMQQLQEEYTKRGVVWLTVNSTHQGHSNFKSAAETLKLVKEFDIKSTNVLLDPEGTVGKLFGARTTPQMFILEKGELRYQGAIDDAPALDSDPRKAKNYVRTALEEILAAKQLSITETKSYGCSVKYRE